MTAQEMIQEVFENLAEPTDLEINTTPGDPTTFNIALPGSQQILRYLNNAMTRVANYQFPNGAILRFDVLQRRLFFQHPAPYTATAVSATANDITIPGFAANLDDDFNGWILRITSGTGAGQTRTVVDSVAIAALERCTVDSAWDTTPDNTSVVELSKSFVELLPPGTPGTIATYNIALDDALTVDSIVKIIDRTDNTVLGRAWYSDIMENATTLGTPGEWYRAGNRIQFDTCFESARSYEIWYYAQPEYMAAATDVPILPAPYHEAITLYATHKLRSRAGDFDGQYVDKRNFIELMATLRSPNSLSLSYEANTISVYD